MSDESGYFYLPPQSVNVSPMTQNDYEKILRDFNLRFLDEVWIRKEKALKVVETWESPYFGAYAKNSKSQFEIHVLGGTVRASGMTENILKTILCHELGHILGGSPLQTIHGSDWASVEGQSDFYAGRVCLPQVLQGAESISDKALKVCDGHRKCAEVAQAGLEFVRFLQKYSYRRFEPVSLARKAPPSEIPLIDTYPSDQCRLDTFVAAGLCLKGKSCRRPPCWLP